ncbi:Metal-dependent hydrolase, endonuclease/exonuclease/phosphatase family [Sphingomonas laterariae]|uniref:Metal-dependent hydrolase, endonuclease/exonuclease/phosphatase family n=1 Tax=Edaphosphingomonas laterariae TaxID=861865 RepID=A0A239FGV7_9SPHN|nr:endonuclease/exonuclease/phosphatase family protein [Sphingomonas laterariae]SNS56037.1 Metal-dependent hydrolase, endonuclease/exonuclease/phosphatase family [Sphingomonas laterariae]
MTAPGPITVASYNIHKAVGTDRKRDPRRILDVLHEIDADIVALQEADMRFGSRVSAIPVDMIAEHSAYKPVDYDIHPGGIGWHGNAILVKRGVNILSHAPLHLPVLEPRGAVVADLAVHGRPIRIVGMHLDLSGLWRRRQVRAILAQVAARSRIPTVMMGDLNEWAKAGGCLREFSPAFQVIETGRSFHSRRPVASLDRIMLGRGVELLACGVHRSAKSSRASDHLPIWAKFAI